MDVREVPTHNQVQIWRRRLILAIWVLSALAAVFGHVRSVEDFGDYVGTGRVVLAGGDIYGYPPNTWPPFFSLLCVPLALLSNLSPYLAVVLWSVLNCVAVLLLCDLGSRLVYGQGLALRDGREGLRLSDAAIYVPVLLTLPYIVDNFQFHQINLIIFLLVLYGLFGQENGHPVRGGIAIGLAAAMKVMPVLFLPYLIWRRRWVAAGTATATAAGLSLSPILVYGWKRFWSYSIRWLHIARSLGDASGPNQSAYAMWDRMIGHGLVPVVARGVPMPFPRSGQPLVQVAWILTFAAIGLGMVIAFRGAPCVSSQCWALEWSVIFLVAAIVGGQTWKHYLVVMLLPNMLLYAAWRSAAMPAQVRRIVGTVLLVCFVLGMVTGYGLVGPAVALRMETASVATDAVLIMLGGLLWLRSRRLTHEPFSVFVS